MELEAGYICCKVICDEALKKHAGYYYSHAN